MPAREPQTITVGELATARTIAVRADAGQGASGKPSLFWLPGFMSDMASTKATAIAEWAGQHGLGCTRFDYSGVGISGGDFSQGTIGRWLDEAEAVFTKVTKGPQIIIGSSMGGHIALLLARRLRQQAPAEARRIAGLVLIAPAWDMTEVLMWQRFSDDVRRQITETGRYLRPSAYEAPLVITRGLIEDGRRHLLARQPFNPGCPVVILQGALDEDVPLAHTRELTTFLTGSPVRLIVIEDGEHRLSRPQDLAQLYAAIESLM